MTQYDYSATRNDLITRAMRLVGAVPVGDVITADQLDQGAQALNEMVMAWQADNIFLWTLVENTLTLSASTQEYATPTSVPIIGIEKAYYINGNSYIPIKIYDYRQWEDIFDKTQTGIPTVIAWIPETPPVFQVWPIPTATGSIKYLGVTQQPDFDASTDTGSFTKPWIRAVVYGLAAELCDEYPLPISERNYLVGKAEAYKKIAMRGNREKPTDDFVRGAFEK